MSGTKNAVSASAGLNKALHNTNQFVFGPVGHEIDYYYTIPKLLQADCSYVVVDPSGSLYRNYAGYLEHEGYDIRCLNLTDTEKSNHYNPFNYIHDKDDADWLAECILEKEYNITGGAPSTDTEKQLLSAAIAHICSDRSSKERTPEALIEYLQSGDTIGIQDTANQPDIARALENVVLCLQVFCLDGIRELTRTDDIGLETIGTKKTALFVIVKTDISTLSVNRIARLLLSQYLREAGRMPGEPGKAPYPPIHTRIFLKFEELDGKIIGLAESFTSVRNYNISCSFIAGNRIVGAMKMYGKDWAQIWAEIAQNCDTHIYIGPYYPGWNGQEIAEHISKRLQQKNNAVVRFSKGFLGMTKTVIESTDKYTVKKISSLKDGEELVSPSDGYAYCRMVDRAAVKHPMYMTAKKYAPYQPMAND